MNEHENKDVTDLFQAVEASARSLDQANEKLAEVQKDRAALSDDLDGYGARLFARCKGHLKSGEVLVNRFGNQSVGLMVSVDGRQLMRVKVVDTYDIEARIKVGEEVKELSTVYSDLFQPRIHDEADDVLAMTGL